MSESNDPRKKEWSVCLSRWFDGTLDEQQSDRFVELLEEEPTRYQDLRRHLLVETALHDLGLGGGEVPTPEDILAAFRKNLKDQPFSEDDPSLWDRSSGIFSGFPDPAAALREIPGWNDLVRQLDALDLSALKQDPETLRAVKKPAAQKSLASSRYRKFRNKLNEILDLSRFATFLLCVFLFAGTLFLSLKTYVQFQGRKTAATEVSVPARLTAGAFARWDDGESLYCAGEAIDARWMRLTEGFASLRLLDGASVIAQGPVEFSVDRDGQLLCKKGRLCLDVPPQKKPLRVSLPEMTVIVRGTRFSVEASALGSEVQLHEGRIDVEHGRETTVVQPGQSLLITNTGDLRRLDADPSTFVSADRMKTMAAESAVRDKKRNEERWQALRKNPSLLYADDFESFPATWTACSVAEGRLPETRALVFQDVESRAPIEIGREFREITLATCVRIDRFGRDHAVILSSSPFRQGGLRLQAEPDGTVRLLLPNNVSKKTFEGCKVFTRSRQGVWTHLAVTVDIETKTITYFVNGKKTFEERRDTLLPFRIDTAMLGNEPSERKGGDVHLHGGMDELLIFDRKLEEKEILDLIR